MQCHANRRDFVIVMIPAIKRVLDPKNILNPGKIFAL